MKGINKSSTNTMIADYSATWTSDKPDFHNQTEVKTADFQTHHKLTPL